MEQHSLHKMLDCTFDRLFNKVYRLKKKAKCSPFTLLRSSPFFDRPESAVYLMIWEIL